MMFLLLCNHPIRLGFFGVDVDRYALDFIHVVELMIVEQGARLYRTGFGICLTASASASASTHRHECGDVGRRICKDQMVMELEYRRNWDP